jgi:hypothetical protein
MKDNKIDIEILHKSLTNRFMKGDFILLGKILKIDSNAARMRFRRLKPEAVRKMKAIVENRENFIQEQTK